MMSMMNEAGFPVLGSKFPLNWEEKRTEKNKDLEFPQNPSETGFWEDMNIVDNGCNNVTMNINPENLKDHAAKIFFSGMIKTDLAYIDKVILCIRDCKSYTSSWEKVLSFNLKENNKKTEKYPYPIGTEFVCKYSILLKDYVKRKYKMIVIDYDQMLNDPEKICTNLKSFIGSGRFDLSKNLIDKKFNNHSNVSCSEKDEFAPGFFDFADNMHNSLKNGNISAQFLENINYWSRRCAEEINKINKELEN